MIKKKIFGFTLIRTRLCRNLVNVSGFTLIELLVVIAIIGVLATLVMANMGGIRARARDAQRQSDLTQIQKALELYKNSQKPVIYPTSANWRNNLETGGFMNETPHDPLCTFNSGTSNWDCPTGSPDYAYTRNATDSLDYTLVACLENESDLHIDKPIVHCRNTNTIGGTYTKRAP